MDEVVANKEEHLKIYKKWLGEEFKVEFESDYSLLLCNHTGIFEIQYLMMKFAPGFIAKTTLKNTPFIGYLADKVETLWLDRKDANSRTQVAEAIKLRQEEFLKKKIFSPLIVFPEGTTTSGKHILKFRRGAFETLQPIKSIVFKSLNHDVGEGIVPTLLQFLVDLSRPYNVFQFIELPVIYPTVFMYENYKSLHPEISNEAEIFAEVIREIWCEIGNFEKSDRNFNDYLDYISLVFKKDTKNT